MAITQNHLPSAGGSLLHPHFQIQADRRPANHQRFLKQRAVDHHRRFGVRLFSDYLACETRNVERLIGATGPWQWLAAFAPEGFFEIWGILPGVTRLGQVGDQDRHHLGSRGDVFVEHLELSARFSFGRPDPG